MPRPGYKSVTITKATYDLLTQHLKELNKNRTYPVSMTRYVTALTRIGLKNYHES
jgi:hypothetical protein